MGRAICSRDPGGKDLVTTIAVTGASGFLGRHVLARLADRDIEVVGVARKRPTEPERGTVRWVEFDIHQPKANPYEVLQKPDVLLHLAWGGLPDYRNAYQLDIELPAQTAFLETMLRAGLKALTITGTCLEYGMQSGQLSEDLRCAPILPYPQSKLALLNHLQSLKSEIPFALTWARLFYMYGKGQQKGSLHSQFLAAHDNGAESFDMSGGKQIRDFLPVEEVAAILCELALSRRDSGTVNVCSGKPITVRDLTKGWAKMLDWDVELNLGVYPYPDYEPMEFWGDNRRLKEVLAGR